jgi:hypothetical protein
MIVRGNLLKSCVRPSHLVCLCTYLLFYISLKKKETSFSTLAYYTTSIFSTMTDVNAALQIHEPLITNAATQNGQDENGSSMMNAVIYHTPETLPETPREESNTGRKPDAPYVTTQQHSQVVDDPVKGFITHLQTELSRINNMNHISADTIHKQITLSTKQHNSLSTPSTKITINFERFDKAHVEYYGRAACDFIVTNVELLAMNSGADAHRTFDHMLSMFHRVLSIVNIGVSR